MPRIIVFDVNETLLDVDALKPHFARAFGDELCCASGSRPYCSIPKWPVLRDPIPTSERSEVPHST